MSTQLTDRDVDILLMAYEYSGVSLDLIRRRFWPLSKSHTPCSERVSTLVKLGYLQGKRLPSIAGIGSGKAFVTIGPKSRPILAKVVGVTKTHLMRARLYSPPFIAHHLAICDFRLSLELAAEVSDILELEEWKCDRELEVKVEDLGTQNNMLLVPDGSFTLALPEGVNQTFYLEVDMGTLAARRLRTKLRGYLSRVSDSIPVIWVTVDENRLASIKRVALEEAQRLRRDPTVFWVTTKNLVSSNTILTSPIWQIVGGPAVSLNGLIPGSVKRQQVCFNTGQIVFKGGFLS